MSYGMSSGIHQYQKVGAYGAAYADPHRLVQMLLDGALDRLAQARGAMERNAIAEKAELISKAGRIIEGLQGSLDTDKGGDIAANLNDLYDYMQRRLLHANVRNDVAALDEISGLLREIRAAWEAIPMEYRQIPAIGTAG